MGKGRKTIGELAKEYMESRGYTFVCYGDACLLHEIAEYAGLGHRGWRTEKQVLDALDRSPLFEKRYFRGYRNRLWRSYHIIK